MRKDSVNNKSLGARVLPVIGRQKAVVAILLMLFAMLFFDTGFYTKYNLMDMLNSAAILEIMAFGVTLTIICGGIDLSLIHISEPTRQ